MARAAREPAGVGQPRPARRHPFDPCREQRDLRLASVHAVLRGHGRRVGRTRIERLMRRAGLCELAALPRRIRTTDSRHGYPIAPNRLGRNFAAAAPNQVWLADLTVRRAYAAPLGHGPSLPTGEGWLYLAAILDMHTRKLVGWSMREPKDGAARRCTPRSRRRR